MANEVIGDVYPARGNVLIAMGAEGRERALACAKTVGFDGRWYDEAKYKKSLETRRGFHWKFFTKYSQSLKSLDLTVPDDVRLLNVFCGEMGFDEAQKEAFLSDLACTTENPQNVVFAAELKDRLAPHRIKRLCDVFRVGGTHVAWVLDGCTENDKRRILEFPRSMTEPKYSDEHLFGAGPWMEMSGFSSPRTEANAKSSALRNRDSRFRMTMHCSKKKARSRS